MWMASGTAPVSEGARFVLQNPLPLNAYANLDQGVPVDRREAGESEDDDNSRRRRRRRQDNRNRPVRGRPSRNGGGGGGGSSEDTDGSGSGGGGGGDIPIFEAVPCMDIEETAEELGEPGPRHLCFACQYVGQDRAAKIPDHRLAALFKIMADGIGVAWPPALAVVVARNYATWRREVNATRKEGEDEIPKWNAASVLDHWYNHTCDPQIALWLDMMAVRYTIYSIRKNSLERRHRITGERRHDKDQWAIYNSAVRLFYTLSAKDPRKLNFYNEGAMINYKTVANRGIATSKRPVYQFFSKEKRIRDTAVPTIGLY